MTAAAKKETLGFETEVKHLLDLMIRSLYSNKEIFLRELISNGSDAADKLRFEALSNDALFEGDSDLKIRVAFDKERRTLTVTDNGIGMTREEVRDNIGTIAKSGTRQFFDSLTGDEAKDSQLIGQFGVGFYSSFIVADKVTLKTRKAGEDAENGVKWESSGDGNYSLETVRKRERGTEVVLHLRDDEDEFLDGYRLRSIIHKYSDHITLPIVMDKEETEEKPKDDKEIVVAEEETVNTASALWVRAKSEISDEEYNEFYKHVGHDFEDPLAYIHSRVEGTNEYTLLLYIPARAPFDLWDRDARKGVKLYVRKIFILDDSDQLMPRFLRFIRGVIDSDSLPLNISREILQQNRQIDTIRAGAVKKILGLLEGLVKDDSEKYYSFWDTFGQAFKEGAIEDHGNKERVAKLLRFSTTHDDNEKQRISLDDYIARMDKDQEKIFYITGDSFSAAKNSPHLEIFRGKGIEVLLLSDRVDEWLATSLTEYEGKQLQSVAKGELDLGKLGKKEDGKEDKESKEKVSGDYKDVIEKIKKTLTDKVSEVRISDRLTESPACLVSESYGMSLNMERIMKESGQAMPGAPKPIFEINPAHALVVQLKEELDSQRFDDLTRVLFDQAVLSEGGQLDDPATFVRNLNGLLQSLLK